MIMSVDAQILSALQKAVGLATTLPIAYIDRTFNVPDDQKYVECVFIPNNIDNGYWGSEKDYRGIFRIILHWPNDDSGPYEAMNVASSIGDKFRKTDFLGGVQIVSEPNLTGPIQNGTERLYPLSMRYQRFA